MIGVSTKVTGPMLLAATLLFVGACSGGSSGGSASPNSPGATGSSSSGNSALMATYKFTGEAPPATAPKPAPGKNVWIISCGQAVSSCASPAADAKEAGQLIGWKMSIADGNLNTANGFGNAMAQAIAAHAEAIILIGEDCTLITSQLRNAKAQRIPVVAYLAFDCNDPHNQNPSDPLFTATVQLNKAYSAPGDFEFARAVTQAQYIISKTNGKAQIIEERFVGPLWGTYADAGLRDGLKSCTGCKIVDTVEVTDADLGAGLDAQKMAAAAVKYPNATVIAYPRSVLVQTSQLTTVARTLGQQVLVVGGEGQVTSLDLIRSGAAAPTAEIAFPTNWLAYGAVDELIRVFAGQPTVTEGIGYAVVDKSQNVGNKGQEYVPPVDYVAAYKKAWGVA